MRKVVHRMLGDCPAAGEEVVGRLDWELIEILKLENSGRTNRRLHLALG